MEILENVEEDHQATKQNKGSDNAERKAIYIASNLQIASDDP